MGGARDAMKNGVPQWIVIALLTLLLSVAGWNYKGVAGDVKENTEDRLQREGAQQGPTIVWLENAVRAIHDEQIESRNVLNRIAKHLDVDQGPAVKPLESKRVPGS